MKKYGMLAVAVGILSASAVCWGVTAISTNPVFLTAIEVDNIAAPGDGGTAAPTSAFLTFSAQPNTKTSCAGVESVISGSAEHVRNTTSLATAAMLAGKKVRVIYSTVAPQCAVYGSTGYSKVAGLRVEQ